MAPSKSIAGPTWYDHNDVARCYAVARRARGIPGEYTSKTRILDAEFCGVPRDSATPGPVTQKLLSYGRIHCIVFGAYGEGSADAHSLVNRLAQCRASRDWARMGCRGLGEATALLSRYLFRSWGIAAVREQARLRIAGLSHVGTGAAAAAGRRSMNSAFHARIREAYQLQHCGGRSFR